MRSLHRTIARVGLASAVAASAIAVTAVTAPASEHRPAAPGVPSTVVRGIDVDTATIPQLEAAMSANRLSAVQLTLFYLHRIQKLNPLLHAVITVDPTALLEARLADVARRHGDNRPLLGIPIIVKDNIDTANMPTTAGSFALVGHNPDRDAFIVRQLESAGAIVLGKANLSEWANFRSSFSSSGWSAVGGQNNNPYVLDRNPCGSSSGSAVASAADLAVAAIGTETDGSIVCPSAANGDVGVKPSLGLVSRSGIVPISAEQDTAGPITRNVTDAAVVLGVIAGSDPDDPITAAAASQPDTYTQFLDPGALQGARIGVWREGNFGVSPDTDAVMEAAIARLKSLGATIVDPVTIPNLDQVGANEFPALLSEFKHDIAAYLATRPGISSKTLADLIQFNDAHAAQEMPWFGQDIFLAAEDSPSLTDPAYIQARQTATSLAQQGIDETLRTSHLDAILAPTNSPAWTTDLVNGDHFLLGSSTPAAVSGYTNVTVPAGFAHGLPIGMSLIGGKFSEPRLLALAFAWEQATHIRRAPQFLPTLPAIDTASHPGRPARGLHRDLAPRGDAS